MAMDMDMDPRVMDLWDTLHTPLLLCTLLLSTGGTLPLSIEATLLPSTEATLPPSIRATLPLSLTLPIRLSLMATAVLDTEAAGGNFNNEKECQVDQSI